MQVRCLNPALFQTPVQSSQVKPAGPTVLGGAFGFFTNEIRMHKDLIETGKDGCVPVAQGMVGFFPAHDGIVFNFETIGRNKVECARSGKSPGVIADGS